MTLRRLTALAVQGFLALKLAGLLVNLKSFPTLRTDRDRNSHHRQGKKTALLVPMRNEEERLPATLAGILAAEVDEVIFLDDRSSDDTLSIVSTAVSSVGRHRVSSPGVRIISGEPRPLGWTGKTWACAQLAEATDADLLVFCDADVVLAPGAVDALVCEMSRQQADVFSVFPRQIRQSWPERLLVPWIDDVLLCFLPFPLLKAPVAAAATACGALMAFTRGAYEQVGGFAAVKSEITEDVAIARRTRKSGMSLGLALGGDAVSTRMYGSLGEIVDGLGRGLAGAANGRSGALGVGLAAHLLAYTAPVFFAFRSPRWRRIAALGLLERILVEAKTGGKDWPASLLVSISPLAAAPVIRQAMRREQSWKGRSYPSSVRTG